MVQELETHDFAGLVHPSCEADILAAGRRVAARVGMEEQDASSGPADRPGDELSGLDRGAGQGSGEGAVFARGSRRGWARTPAIARASASPASTRVSICATHW